MAYTAGLAMTAYQPQKYTNGHITQINIKIFCTTLMLLLKRRKGQLSELVQLDDNLPDQPPPVIKTYIIRA